MNKWQQIEDRLSGVFGSVKAFAGGHEISLEKQVDKERLVVAVYVDGWIRGEWTRATADGEPENPQAMFWKPYRTRPWKLSQYKDLKKVFGKKRADEMTALKTCAFMPYWNTPKSLVRHLKKHFPDLEILEPDLDASK
ncbi:hypothetical protein Q673_06260 [Marinobacter sp. EN3]|uniref:hypothetical protein n=1 Tax=Marinobacter sp. EN3 TaxID=1397533 RepID=UPI0003B862E2|nr:hypothetical protein [Marinobacter sp. EN3]ERS04815.1 hypothetical protein Q673_06260 [Marinobacter sp. EN3]